MSTALQHSSTKCASIWPRDFCREAARSRGSAGTRGAVRGPLGAWLRIAAIRAARDIKRTVRVTDDIADHAIPGDGKDIEVAFRKRQFASVFSEAFQAVLATLTTDERNVLRLHYLDGLTIEQVGRTYGVSRATAARWLQSARATIVERIRAALSDRVDPGSAGPSSVLALVQSQLGMSLRRHLA